MEKEGKNSAHKKAMFSSSYITCFENKMSNMHTHPNRASEKAFYIW
jgi:hypothetical protein